MTPRTSFKRLILRVVLRKVRPMVSRVMAVPDHLFIKARPRVPVALLLKRSTGQGTQGVPDYVSAGRHANHQSRFVVQWQERKMEKTVATRACAPAIVPPP
jgi:hypothetical protein